jgi:hypothetical protein
MLALLSCVLALACVLAATRRLLFVVEATSFDPALVLGAWRAADPRHRETLRGAIAREALPWEAEVFAALDEADAPARDAALEEQLLELDWRARRWGRVPRVCASIATSGGFLLASVAVMQGLAAPPGEIRGAMLATLVSAVDALAVGIAGAVFCVFVHLRTRHLTRERVGAAQRLVAALAAPETPEPEAPPRAARLSSHPS